jgi:hypothetical protein
MKNKISSLIGIPLFLISTNTYSQTLLTINAEVVNSKKMFSPIPVLFPVEQQEVEINGQKRQAYILQRGKTISIDSEEAFATYKEISSDVGYNDKAIPNISVADEISVGIREHFKIERQISTLLENSSTKKLYMMNFDQYDKIRKFIKEENEETKNINFLISLGYKIYDDEGFNVFNTKYYMVTCNPSLYSALKKDKSYLTKLDNLYLQEQNLRKQAQSYTPKLANYIRLYRIQRNKMSKTDIGAWTVLTKSAMKLNQQFVELNDKMIDGVDHFPLDKNHYKTANDFTDNLGASMGVLGL